MSKKPAIDPHKPLTKKELDSLGVWMHGIEELPADASNAVKRSLRGRPHSRKNSPHTPQMINDK